jgi:xanthine dehydrogenase accessory factor
MSAGLIEMLNLVETGDPQIRVSVIDAAGSVPREAGAVMRVGATDTSGTIGGGALEFDAIATARRMLAMAAQPWLRTRKTCPLGPSLGQCCGGSVSLLFERFERSQIDALPLSDLTPDTLLARPTRPGVAPISAADRHELGDDLPLHVRSVMNAMLTGRRARGAVLVSGTDGRESWWIEPVKTNKTTLILYGAGHVGREIVQTFERLPFQIIWVDTDANRFPSVIPAHATRLIAVKPADAVAHLPPDALHLVMTYSHPIDLEICHAVLKRDEFAFLGLIGSHTKRVRFLKRLAELGHDAVSRARLVCPIGIEGLTGKEPAVIAVSVAAQLIQHIAVSRVVSGSKTDTNLAESG